MLVVSAKYVAPLKVELHFSDGTVKTIDVGAFIRKHPHPQYNSFFPFGVSTDLQSVVKNVLTSLCSGDLQSPVIGSGSFVIGGLQIPRFHRSNFFLRRISNPPGRAHRGLFTVRRSDGFAIRR